MNATRRQIVFLINLLQDVNTIRPLAFLAAAQTDADITFLVSTAFMERDRNKMWLFELDRMRYELNAALHRYGSELDAFRLLGGKSGLLIAGSESHLAAHAETHNVFRIAPPGFLRVTLQHGFECVGFLQNYEQTAVHGAAIRFAADVICGWCDAAKMRSVAASERDKLYIAGPPSLIHPDEGRHVRRNATPPGGMVCENLHSVRLNVSGNLKAPFIRQFYTFCGNLEEQDATVTLRPHPGGQYVVKNNVQLPVNAALDQRPMYRVDLAQYRYGISAPSSVLIDFVLAGVPTGVWIDPDSLIDASSYRGLTFLSGAADWIAFADEATRDPAPFLAKQTAFLHESGLIADSASVRDRYARLIAGGDRIVVTSRRKPPGILFVANGEIPSLHISFIQPLRELAAAGELRVMTLTETALVERFEHPESGQASRWIVEQIDHFDPAMIVSCRYSGPHSEAIYDLAEQRGIPTVFHLDDDLLNVPIELGERKYRLHNSPTRLAAVETQLVRADLVYCSTEPLRARMAALNKARAITAGRLYCSAVPRREAIDRDIVKIGYMGGGDHRADLDLAMPAIAAVLSRNPHVVFEIFGSFVLPADLIPFEHRTSIIPPIADYDEFLRVFASMDWDIGIAPLADTPFNRVKADTKWVEYSAVGIAVVSSRGLMYDRCSSDGCGMLAGTTQEWVDALEALCRDPALRLAQVAKAQQRLLTDYTPWQLTEQVIAILSRASGSAAGEIFGTATPAQSTGPVV